jgi:hypothetical protein
MDATPPPPSRHQAVELLQTMVDQVLDCLQSKTDCNHHCHKSNKNMSLDPEWEVHLEEIQVSRKKELYQRLDEIRILQRLFEEQKRTIHRLEQQQQANPARNNARGPTRTNTLVQRDPLSEHGMASNGIMIDFNKNLPAQQFDVIHCSSTQVLEEGAMPTHRKTSSHFSPSSVPSDYDCNPIGEFGEDDFFDDDSFSLDLDGTDSEIQAAINEIRKMASRTNLVMALNQLDSLQNELTVASKELDERSAEADELRRKLDDSELRIASLELERDLFQADATKAKEDLRICVGRMFDISLVGGDISPPESDDGRENPALVSQDVFRPKSSTQGIAFSKFVANQGLPDLQDPSAPSNQDRVAPQHVIQKENGLATNDIPVDFQQLRHLQHPSFPSIVTTSSISATSQTQRAQQKGRGLVRKTWDSHNYRKESHPGKLAKHATWAEFPQAHGQPERGSKSDRCTSPTPSTRNRCQTPRSTPHKLWRTTDLGESSDKENRMGGLFKRKPQQSLPLYSYAVDVATMRQEIERLQERMKSSVLTAGHLRKRLATVSRYYEGVLRKVEERMASMKIANERMEIDLLNQISTIYHEKRVTVVKFESTLRQREDEIARLKRPDLLQPQFVLL